MAQNETWLNHDLSSAVKVQYLDGNLFSMDNAGNLIGVILTKDGVAYSGGGTVSANVIRADGGTVAVTGALSGNVATVVLPQAAYAVPGVASVVIKLTVSGEVTTIGAVVANVYESTTSTTIDPGTIIPSIQTLVNQINTAVSSIPADYSSLWTSLAPAFSTSTAYTAGQYVTYNGGLYRFTADHAAGSWSSSDVTAAKLGNDISDLKSAITDSTGYRQIEITYPWKYINTGGSTVDITTQTASTSLSCSVVSCSEGDVFTLHCVGGSNGRAYAFIRNDGTVIKRAGTNTTINEVMVAPENSAYLIIHNNTASYPNYYSYYGDWSKTLYSMMMEKSDIAGITQYLDYQEKMTWTTGKAIKAETGNENYSEVFKSSDYIPVHGHAFMYVTIPIYTPSYPPNIYGYAFYDSSYNYISGTPLEVGVNSEELKKIEIPNTAYYFRTSYYDDSYTNYTSLGYGFVAIVDECIIKTLAENQNNFIKK